jgi:hypothetical protein
MVIRCFGFHYPIIDCNVNPSLNSKFEVEKKTTGGITSININYADDGVNFVNKNTYTITDANLYIRLTSIAGTMAGETINNCVHSSGFIAI